MMSGNPVKLGVPLQRNVIFDYAALINNKSEDMLGNVPGGTAKKKSEFGTLFASVKNSLCNSLITK